LIRSFAPEPSMMPAARAALATAKCEIQKPAPASADQPEQPEKSQGPQTN
jgi:hypothetical protein